jgi:ribosomal protein S18 acetylase RimI-like enzyme
MDTATHPDHDQLVHVVGDWFHLPYQGMGYQAERTPWGTYWNTGHVYTAGFPPDRVKEFLADARRYYGHRPVFINIDDADTDSELGPALIEAGCSRGKADIFLAHVGPVARFTPLQGLQMKLVSESNFPEFAETRLRAFADSEEEPDGDRLRDEIDRRRAELAGSGRGMLARFQGEPAGVMWWYDEGGDVWILYLATRMPFRGRGIGRRLLSQCLVDSYDRGCRSVMINVETHNTRAIRLYLHLGFRDQIHWRRRYLPSM